MCPDNGIEQNTFLPAKIAKCIAYDEAPKMLADFAKSFSKEAFDTLTYSKFLRSIYFTYFVEDSEGCALTIRPLASEYILFLFS